MINFFLGAAGMLMVVGAFFAGIFVERRYAKIEKADIVLTDPQDEGKTPEEIEADRRKLIAEQNAFREMQNYNPAVAYKVKAEEDELR